MLEIFTLVIYFFVGVVQDFFFTMNVKFVAEKKVFPAVVFSFMTVFLSMVVLYNIIKDLDISQGILAIVVYSLGIATGTFVAMKLPKLKK